MLHELKETELSEKGTVSGPPIHSLISSSPLVCIGGWALICHLSSQTFPFFSGLHELQCVH